MENANRYVCVHGHFYQPPRENPSLEAVEVQDSAYPYHDWNERITAECYAPNAQSRLLDDQQRIVSLVSNYAQMSFNFGPTLLLWMEQKAPAVLELIKQSDKQSQEKFGGHGSAIAQAYNHMILPLSNTHDKETQVIWGIRDFEARFGRRPEGMWLPETAVDLASLETLAAQGVDFTILAPRQAKRVRRNGSRSWKDVSGSRIDPSRAYRLRLPSRKTITLFFYDGPISQGVAFEGLLDDGRRFADRLLSGFSDARTWPQLCHIATDGESYGHHHHYGEMALSYALHSIESEQKAKLTNYGQFLEMYPPDHWVEIFENSSWSCVHGIERWKSNCGCNSGGRPGWDQEWRAPLRAALDWLRDTLAPKFEEQGGQLLRDPWAARNDYIGVVLNRAPENVDAFLAKHAARELSGDDRIRTLKLLEMQRHAMLMYTSCGWFFDELSGLETVQVMHYAARAIQLAREAAGTGEDVEQTFASKLAEAKSNLLEHGDGEKIYKKWVIPAVVTMEKVAAHYAISSLFENYGDQTNVYCYGVNRKEYAVETEGRLRVAAGRALVHSNITSEEVGVTFGALHFGDHNITCGVRRILENEDFGELKRKLTEAFGRADTAEVIRILDAEFANRIFSLQTLFRDEQRHIVDIILKDTLASVSASFKSVYENQAALLRFLTALNFPAPSALASAATVALNGQLEQAIEKPEIDPMAIKGLLREAETNRITLDSSTLEYTMRKRIEEQAAQFAKKPEEIDTLKRLHSMLDIAAMLPFPVNLWQVQNLCFAPLTYALSHQNGDGGGPERRAELASVGNQLRIKEPNS